ncbi:hypothetical protein MCP1_600010 [Candidatus Terasakiella magnetica]|nr:hypothetical protein MCP1_600010 [Candidatus Terasakiella magnetica]
MAEIDLGGSHAIVGRLSIIYDGSSGIDRPTLSLFQQKPGAKSGWRISMARRQPIPPEGLAHIKGLPAFAGFMHQADPALG